MKLKLDFIFIFLGDGVGEFSWNGNLVYTCVVFIIKRTGKKKVYSQSERAFFFFFFPAAFHL